MINVDSTAGIVTTIGSEDSNSSSNQTNGPLLTLVGHERRGRGGEPLDDLSAARVIRDAPIIRDGPIIRDARLPLYKGSMLRRFYFVLIVFTACCGFHRNVVEDVSGDHDLSIFKLQSVQGVRDGDHLSVQVGISDSSSVLSVSMRFAVGSPTKLESGNWYWTHPESTHMDNGEVAERSVTFLGGQDGPPSIGGSFDLLTPEGTPKYRLNLPVTELKR